MVIMSKPKEKITRCTLYKSHQIQGVTHYIVAKKYKELVLDPVS
jgi:hypothetical protein